MGERESLHAIEVASPSGDRARRHEVFSLSPSEGERVRVRGGSNCIVTAKKMRFEIGAYLVFGAWDLELIEGGKSFTEILETYDSICSTARST